MFMKIKVIKKVMALFISMTMFSATFANLNINLAEGLPNETLSEFTTGSYAYNNGVLTVNNNNGNNLVVSNQTAKAFTLSADFYTTSARDINNVLANIIFDIDTPQSVGTNFAAASMMLVNDKIRIFKEDNRTAGSSPDGEFLNAYYTYDDSTVEIDASKALYKFNLKLAVTEENMFYVYLNGKKIASHYYSKYDGGYVGFMTFRTVVEISNIKFTTGQPVIDEGFNTNLSGWRSVSGGWSTDSNGLRGNNISAGDRFYASRKFVSADETFVYSATISKNTGSKGGGLAFGITDATSSTTISSCWIGANFDLESNVAKLFKVGTAGKWTASRALTPAEISSATYELRVEVVKGGYMSYYLNGSLVGSYTDQSYTGGYFGLYTWKGDNYYNNVNLTIGTPPSIVSIAAKGHSINPAKEYTDCNYDLNVPNEEDVAYISMTVAEGCVGTINGNEVENGEYVPIYLHVGSQRILLTSQDTVSGIAMSQYLHIGRAAKAGAEYTEIFRPQFHYSPFVNWGNDPNGLMYNEATKEYHFFYQYNPYSYDWGNMSWGHAVSKDLITWEEKEPALYPDKYGAIFSGCGVIDRNNTSNLFDETVPAGGRMVAVYSYNGGDSTHGNQKIALAYSLDNGDTWIKYQGEDGDPIVIENDGNKYGTGFRDPKVIWVDDATDTVDGGHWLLVLAGGTARIFTSEDLINWDYNSDITYIDENSIEAIIQSECPDLYPLVIEGTSKTKWIYNGSGEFFVVGDLIKDLEGKYKFVPETGKISTKHTDSRMYATMTFFNDALNRRLQMSWVRDMSAQYFDKEGKIWNGLYTVPRELSLRATGGGSYILATDTIQEIEQYRDTTYVNVENTQFTEGDRNLLENIEAEMLDISAKIDIGNATQVGFKLRVKGDNYLDVYFNKDTGKLVFDGSRTVTNSGVHYNRIESMNYSLGEDNILDLRILLDVSAIDIYADNGAVGTTTMYFMDTDNTGAEFYVNGGTVTIKSMQVYGIKSGHYNNNQAPIDVFISGGGTVQMDSSIKLHAETRPTFSTNGAVTWSVSDSNIVQIVSLDDNNLILKGNKVGTATITAMSEGGVTNSVTVIVTEKNFHSNVENWSVVKGNWVTTKNGYEVDDSVDGDSMLMANSNTKNFTIDADAELLSPNGQFGVMFGVNADSPQTDFSAVNIDKFNNIARVFVIKNGVKVFGKNVTLTEELMAAKNYHFNMTVLNGIVTYYLNNVHIATVDINTYYNGGNIGLLSYSKVSNNLSCNVAFNNFYYTPVYDDRDINRDGNFNSLDLAYLRKIFLGIATPQEGVNIDLNKDGSENIADLVRLKKELANQ